MKSAIKGSWVEVEMEVLAIGERAPQVPEDTQKTPLMMWAKGFLVDEQAEVGEDVTIKTLSNRVLSGKLVGVQPRYEHDYGNTVNELLETGIALKDDLGGM